MIVVLAGGVGAARFLQGLVQIVPQQRITVIGNTGDDRDFYGLHVSPDLDIVTYTLAGVVDETHGLGHSQRYVQYDGTIDFPGGRRLVYAR